MCAVSCANMALRSQIWPAKPNSPPRGLLLGTRRGSQVAAGRVGAARSPCWGRLRAAPVLGGYRDLVSGGREPPPPALLEPYVTVSRHTAPTVRRWVEARRCQ